MHFKQMLSRACSESQGPFGGMLPLQAPDFTPRGIRPELVSYAGQPGCTVRLAGRLPHARRAKRRSEVM